MSKPVTYNLSVRSVNEHAYENPDILNIDITPDLLRRIKRLSATVKSMNLFMAEELNAMGRWTDNEGGTYRTQNNVMQVEENVFRFCCVPKHAGDGDLLHSEYLYIEEVEKAFPDLKEQAEPDNSMKIVTAVVIDKDNNVPTAEGVFEPLIYDVEVADPNDHHEVAVAAAAARGRDLGIDIDHNTIVPQFVIKSDSEVIADYRTG